MTVLTHPAHKRYRCKDDCQGCHTCVGGLFSCTRCNGAEGTLPTDCPGSPMTEAQQDAVMAGDLDYDRKLGWVDRTQAHG